MRVIVSHYKKLNRDKLNAWQRDYDRSEAQERRRQRLKALGITKGINNVPIHETQNEPDPRDDANISRRDESL